METEHNSIGLIIQDIVSAEKYGELNTDYLQKSRQNHGSFEFDNI